MNQDNTSVIWEWTSCAKATAGGVVLQHGCIVHTLSKCVVRVVQATNGNTCWAYQNHISTSSLRLWACVAVSQEPAGRQMWYRVHVVRSPAPNSTDTHSADMQRLNGLTFSDKIWQHPTTASSHPKVWHIDHSLLECLYPSCVAHTLFGVFAVNKERLTLRILEWKNMQHNPKDRQRGSNHNNYLSKLCF